MSEEKEYFVVSVKWTERREPYITLWGPNNSGYRGRIESSGRYKHSDVMKHLDDYNTGYHTLAVPCELIEPLAVDIKPGWLDGDGGKWIPNNKAIRYRKAYETRHTFACWALSAGANPNFIAHQLGHSSAQMLYTVYGRWMTENNLDQIGILNAEFSQNAPSMPHNKTA